MSCAIETYWINLSTSTFPLIDVNRTTSFLDINNALAICFYLGYAPSLGMFTGAIFDCAVPLGFLSKLLGIVLVLL